MLGKGSGPTKARKEKGTRNRTGQKRADRTVDEKSSERPKTQRKGKGASVPERKGGDTPLDHTSKKKKRGGRQRPV